MTSIVNEFTTPEFRVSGCKHLVVGSCDSKLTIGKYTLLIKIGANRRFLRICDSKKDVRHFYFEKLVRNVQFLAKINGSFGSIGKLYITTR